jgi:hypothetical protein
MLFLLVKLADLRDGLTHAMVKYVNVSYVILSALR